MDSYIVVTRSGWWFLLAALLILFAGLFIVNFSDKVHSKRKRLSF
jgi:hypothetical protein